MGKKAREIDPTKVPEVSEAMLVSCRHALEYFFEKTLSDATLDVATRKQHQETLRIFKFAIAIHMIASDL